MRVLMISLDGSIARGAEEAGGSRDRHLKYARALADREPGGELTVVVPRAPGRESRSHVQGALRVVPVAGGSVRFLLTAARAADRQLGAREHALITTQSPFADAVLGLWLAARHSLPTNVQMHSSFLDMRAWIRERPVGRRVLNRVGKATADAAATVRVVSEGERARLERIRPGLAARLHVLPVLVDRDRFARPVTAEERKRVSAALDRRGWPDDAPVALFVGRLSREKNLPTLLRAMARVRRELPAAVLVVAGDGPLRSSLRRPADRLGVSGGVLWLGAVAPDALRAWYARADVTVLPSFYEGYGRAIVESALAGTPVVATPFVSAPELIVDGGTGIITRSFEDAAELASAIQRYAGDREASRAHGREARAHIDDYLPTETEYMDRLVGIWRATAEAAPRAGAGRVGA